MRAPPPFTNFLAAKENPTIVLRWFSVSSGMEGSSSGEEMARQNLLDRILNSVKQVRRGHQL